jgi:hypothetical protein
MQEKQCAANKPLYIAEVDLEKAFDHVPMKVLWWALRISRTGEWAAKIIQAMYTNMRILVYVNGVGSIVA